MYLEPLIVLFGAYAIKEIENPQSGRLTRLARGFGRDLSDLEKDDAYATPYAIVKQAKLDLEEIGESGDGELEQVRSCLQRLHTARDECKETRVEALSRLANEWFIAGRRWSASASETYKLREDIIKNWHDFFLSYTNRSAPPVNTDYKDLIYYNFRTRLRKLYETRNCAARVIQRYLQLNNIRGFFDVERIQCGDDIGNSIKTHCHRTFSLIQFVQEEALSDPDPGKENWCWNEYKYFQKTSDLIKDLLGRSLDNFYVITRDVDDTRTLLPARRNRNYKDWFDHIVRVEAERLSNEASRAKLWAQMKGMAERIGKQRDEVINQVLYH